VSEPDRQPAKHPRAIALVPARSGSQRAPHKNVRVLAGHPLMAYTIAAARASGVFDAVLVSTDDPVYAEVATHYRAEAPFLRPPELAGATSPDIEWIAHTLERLADAGRHYDAFSILRPTSPFRAPETIRRAWAAFLDEPGVDSLRAVELVLQHPGKMWVVRGSRMTPLLPLNKGETPWHSQQYAALPKVYVQNASLEIAWTRVVTETRTISGHVLMPFMTQGLEGFDVNNENEWDAAIRHVAAGAALPGIAEAPFPAARLPGIG
jgi:CMP-N,N'-diacetyllegionaminic acid synthase